MKLNKYTMLSFDTKTALLITTLMLTACTETATTEQTESLSTELTEAELNLMPKSTGTDENNNEFVLTDWEALIPKSDLEALLTPPDYLNDIVDGSVEDSLEKQIESAFNKDQDPYQQALVSTNVIAAMDGKRIKIPGFVVPVETNEDNLITEFFIVPYFGACLHMPPPPPNQIIYASYPQGLKQPTLYDAFWLSGELKTEVITNDIAQAAYQMRVVSYQLYQDEEFSE